MPVTPRIKLVEDLDNPPAEVGEILGRYMERTDGEYMKIAQDVDHPWRKKGSEEHSEWVFQIAKAYGLSPRLLELKLAYDWYLVREGLIGKKDPKLAEMMGVVIAAALQCPY